MKKSTTIPMRLSPLAVRPDGGRRRFHLMIKPGGSACNLACDYCYYLHKGALLGQEPAPSMPPDMLERVISQYIEGNGADEVVFSWQGGEPTLLGIGFFERAVALQQKYAPPERRVANTLQTNGVLLDDDWAAFLKRHEFRVGLSVDGPEALHDRYRRDASGKPTFAKVMAAHARLVAHGIPFSILATVNRENSRHPDAVYCFLTEELGADYIQFNPCVEPTWFATTAPHFWREEELPREHLCRAFDLWAERDLGRVLVNWFETAVAQTLRLPAQICPTGPICGKGLAVERDGSAYSCDHYVYPEYRLGGVDEFTLGEMAFSERQMAFGLGKRETLPERCLRCPHGLLCWGQCPRHRFLVPAEGGAPVNYLCAGWRKFYDHAKPLVRNIAAGLTASPADR